MEKGQSLDRALQALFATQTVNTTRRPDIEALLTDGYARVLELEAERRRLMAESDRADAVDDITRQLVSLRDRLDEANRRFGGSRQGDAHRGPLTGDGAHDKRPA